MNEFYHATTRKLVVIFASIFNEMYINIDGKNKYYKVPINFASKEKFLTILEQNPDPYSATSSKQAVWMSFALMGLNYSAERATKNIGRIKSKEYHKEYMLNRVPYDLNFELYISSKQLEQSLMIVEQIIPIFKPDYNVTINEIDDFILNTDISISLDSIQPDIDSGGDVNEQRNIFWTLSFTMKAWYYPRVDQSEIIKETIVNMLKEEKDSTEDLDVFIERYTSSVVPREAKKDEDHEIVDKLETKYDG